MEIKYGWSPTAFVHEAGSVPELGRPRMRGWVPATKKRHSHTPTPKTRRNTPPRGHNLASLRNCPSWGFSGCKRPFHRSFPPPHADASVGELSIDFVVVLLWSFVQKKAGQKPSSPSCRSPSLCGEWPVPAAPLTAPVTSAGAKPPPLPSPTSQPLPIQGSVFLPSISRRGIQEQAIHGPFVSARHLATPSRADSHLARPRWHRYGPPTSTVGPLVPVSGPLSAVGWPWLVSPVSRASKQTGIGLYRWAN